MEESRRTPRIPPDSLPIEPYFRDIPGAEPFLRAIAAEPWEPAPRLVFADWLDEQGHTARAAFLRRHADGSVGRPADEDAAAWRAGVPVPAGVELDWSGGLLSAVRVRPGGADTAGLRVLARVVDLHAVATEDLEDSNTPEEVAAVADARPVSLRLVGFTRAHAAALAGVPDLPAVHELALPAPTRTAYGPNDGMTAFELRRLLATPLHRLDLSNHGLTDVAAGLLAACPGLTGLRELLLDSNEIGDGGLRTLAASPILAGLGRLDVIANRIGPDGFRALANSPHLIRLERLAAEYNLTDEVMAILASAPALSRLRDFPLWRTHALTAAGWRSLAAAPWLANVPKLDLFECRIDADGFAALASSPHVGRLEVLSLRDCRRLDAAGMAALADGPWRPPLRVLDLTGHLLGPEGARALARVPWLEGATELRLNLRTHEREPEAAVIGDAGVAALAASPFLSGLRELWLGQNNVGPVGAAALASASWLPGLRTLRLTGSGFLGVRQTVALGDAGVAALAASPGLAGLEELDLTGQQIGNAGIVALAASPHLAGLRRLRLAHNPITDAGAATLAASPHLRADLVLGIDANRIGGPGEEALRARWPGVYLGPGPWLG